MHLRDGAELMLDGPMVRSGARMLKALADSVGQGVVTSGYKGRHRLLVMYGAGRQDRQLALRAHLRAGGRVACWDLGYFDRDRGGMRVSLDGLHPTAEHLELAPDAGRRAFELREDADINGPVLLVGMGPKACQLHGLAPLQWERERLAELRRSGRAVRWRPKVQRGRDAPQLAGTTLATGPIDQALRGCSLVVCRHSNVAVDAAVAGVPVQCEDGAAAALYAGGAAPTREQRAEFLRRLTWWNWLPTEAGAAWEWMLRTTA